MKMFNLVFIMLLISCSSTKDDLPDGIISKDKMIAIMIEIHETEAKMQAGTYIMNDSVKKIEYGYYHGIFIKHKVTPEEFKKSFSWYSDHLEHFNKMYDEVITGLSRKQAEEQAR